MSTTALLITCEHGGNHVPPDYAALFTDHQDLLATHAGYDIGALELADILGSQLAQAYFFSTTTRLLIELNRSLHHPRLFSELTKHLPRPEKQKIIEEYYLPYRTSVIEQIKNWQAQGHFVLHISVHSFTPIRAERAQNADLGLLYDPKRGFEQNFVRPWRQHIQNTAPHLRLRLNYPYRGSADGFTTHLRKLFPENYAGIELEVNQALLQEPGPRKQEIEKLIVESITKLIQ